MARIVNGWKKSFFGRVESVLGRAQILSTYYHLAGRPDYLADDLARYTELDAAAVHREAQKWLSKKRVRIDIVPTTQKPTPAGEKDAPAAAKTGETK